jgi:hypothetical protein
MLSGHSSTGLSDMSTVVRRHGGGEEEEKGGRGGMSCWLAEARVNQVVNVHKSGIAKRQLLGRGDLLNVPRVV